MEVIIDGVRYIPVEEDECCKERAVEERFPIGSFVEIIGHQEGNCDVGEFGKVVGYEEVYGGNSIAVEVARPGKGHDCRGFTKDKHGWWVHPDDLRLVY